MGNDWDDFTTDVKTLMPYCEDNNIEVVKVKMSAVKDSNSLLGFGSVGKDGSETPRDKLEATVSIMVDGYVSSEINSQGKVAFAMCGMGAFWESLRESNV